MSVLPLKADIRQRKWHVRCKPKPSGTRKVSRKGGSKKRSTVSTGAN
jgi:hypothetical protein